MEKLVYILFEPEVTPGAELREGLIEKAAPALRALGAMQIVVNVHDEHVAAGQPIRRSDPPVRAMVAFWLQTADDREPCSELLRGHCADLAGHLVVESRPILHQPPVGSRAPGMNQVTCIAKRPDLSDEEFLRIWHGDHKQVAIETQSTFGYVRNEIVRAFTTRAPAWTAIVEESFPIEALDDPKVFYAAGSDEELAHNLDRMMQSCRRFLDFEPMECTHMSEYYLG